ncbi:MAG: hypothetical protein NC336_09335 [Clostridium sp.]|nr:hypothetical protein [Clostridium sp.]
MNRITNIYSLLAVAGAVVAPAFGLSAQDLTKEITVEHEIVTEKREALKPGLTPSVTLAPVRQHDLKIYADGVSVGITPLPSRLAPAVDGDTVSADRSRGYAAAGYFPIWNTALSAGYRFVETGSTRFRGWIQYDGVAYTEKRSLADGEQAERKIRRNTASAFLSLDQKAGRHGLVEALGAYTYDRMNLPRPAEPSFATGHRTVNRASLSATYRNEASWLGWYAGASFGFFGNSGEAAPVAATAMLLKPVDETTVRVVGGVSTRDWSVRSSWGIDAEYANYSWSRRYLPASGSDASGMNGSTDRGLLTLKPHYTWSPGKGSVRIGARVDVAFNSGRVFNIAPDLLLQWSPVAQFSIGARATGGVRANTFAELSAVTPWCSPWAIYGNSRVDLDLEGEMRVGPWNGLSLELFGGYATGHDWLMPVGGDGPVRFEPMKLSGAHLGGALNLDAPRWVSLRLSYDRSLSDSHDNAWLYWRDRACQVVRGSLTVTPLEPLAINVAMEFRDGRHIFEALVDALDYSASGPSAGLLRGNQPLGVAADLSVGASWQFGPKLSVFLRGENLLGRRWYELGMMRSQGVHGLAGVTCKF